MMGISLHNISRITPPKHADKVPNETQIMGGKPAAIPFSTPTQYIMRFL